MVAKGEETAEGKGKSRNDCVTSYVDGTGVCPQALTRRLAERVQDFRFVSSFVNVLLRRL